MLSTKAKIISLSKGQLAIYLPKALVTDSQFKFSPGDIVEITHSKDSAQLTVTKR
jgi:hypothetical protein